MAAITAGAHGSADAAAADRPTPIRLRPVGARRRPVAAAVSVAVVLASAAVVGAAFAAAGRTVPVLVVTRPLGVGSVIATGDIGVVSVHVPSGVRTVAASSEASVVGRAAAHHLAPGTLLTVDDVTEGAGVPAGDALVGVAVTAAQMPVGGLYPGARVDVVETAAPGSPASLAPAGSGAPTGVSTGAPTGVAASPGSAPGSVVVSDVPVRTVGAIAAGSGPTTTVTLEVPVVVAPLVAQLSAAGQAAVVAVSAGS